jgi:hypothetical protein
MHQCALVHKGIITERLDNKCVRIWKEQLWRMLLVLISAHYLYTVKEIMLNSVHVA